MKRIESDGLVYYQAELAATHGVFTRLGGVSPAPWASLNMGGMVGDDPAAVKANHARMCAALGLNNARSCTTWQVHGADVVAVTHPVVGRRWLAKADAMISNLPDTPLFMRYADCVPLLFHDPVQQAIGIAHAGWRGTVQGMARRTIEAMCAAYGSHAADIRVAIGPSIGPECFQVGEEVVTALQAHFGTTEGLMHRDPADGTAYVDLWEANRRDLVAAGVVHVEVMGLCTITHNHEFFSHRAEKGRTGRFAAVIAL